MEARSYFPGIGEAVADRTINRFIYHGNGEPDILVKEFKESPYLTAEQHAQEYCRTNKLAYAGVLDSVTKYGKVNVAFRTKGTTERETWGDVAKRVAAGNASLIELTTRGPAKRKGQKSSVCSPQLFDELRAQQQREREGLQAFISSGALLMSGRHLQHGDENQIHRNMEVFTNCATAATAFMSFYLLLNGSGVGRCYDDNMMVVDWSKMPLVIPVIDHTHPDVLSGAIPAIDKRDIAHRYAFKKIIHHEVEDSREGWAKAIELLETLTLSGRNRNALLLLDFSKVRPRGSAIGGMQDRPASGPGPLMEAIRQISYIRGADMPSWRATMYIDHYLAECVLVGGARRAARMAAKFWKDLSVLDFIQVKRPIEFIGKTQAQVAELRKTGFFGSFLWSSNNSVMVDAEFWRYVKHMQNGRKASDFKDPALAEHAWRVFTLVTECSYGDGTGEPGLINVDQLDWNEDGLDETLYRHLARIEPLVGSERFKLSTQGMHLYDNLIARFRCQQYKVLVNPCGEIVLSLLGAFCVIADVVPYLARFRIVNGKDTLLSDHDWDEKVFDAVRTAVRALMRVNLMDSVYGPEVRRTNRIGVGLTGVHEYAWTRFGISWDDMVNTPLNDEDFANSALILSNCNKSKHMQVAAFWQQLAKMKCAILEETRIYAEYLGVTVPHTNTTGKPSGTVAKLFGMTEGFHLAALAEYLRWVQFRSDDHETLEGFKAKKYPVRELKTYSGTTIVGFPTRLEICRLGMGSKLKLAGEATPEEQYEYLRRIDRFWLQGQMLDATTNKWSVCADPCLRNGTWEESSRGNQISYTLKYDPAKVSYEDFVKTFVAGQSSVRCCSVMPQTDTSSYEYQPEQSITRVEFDRISSEIERAGGLRNTDKEDVDFAHVDCTTQACPIDFNK